MTKCCLIGVLAILSVPLSSSADERTISFQEQDDRILVRLGPMEIATYVYRDEKVPRPYLTDVKTPRGIQVTRRHPPQSPEDPVDHIGLHTGIWMSFGDLSGFDYWRLKARTEHIEFTQKPIGGAGRGSFAVRNRYLKSDGEGVVCEETCRYDIRTVAGGYLIEMTATFRPVDDDIAFGDQEEMGLGIRVASPLAVDRKQGGRILDSAGRRNGDQVWGKTATWCDYSGPIDNRWVGLTAMASPDNFRPCWMHARDYGFLALNPFGKRAFTRGEPSRIVVPASESLELRFGIVVHESMTEDDYDAANSYRIFTESRAR